MTPLILIVDDDADLRRALRRQLERAAYEVAEADSPASALSTMASAPPDVVISDVMMPGGNGLDFYPRLIAEHPALEGRVIFLTGIADDPLVSSRIEEIGAPLLGKLEDLAVVVDAVRLALFRRGRAAC
ncbi:MAG: response regulator [Gemmatimonadetes bacterium]|nr:response regulator [Gemmatimonadota bacterium]MCB9505585.1 response regulator [Gemmatimonadales bacterium]MCA9761817.1 response regulator [Gemmatimonadota bacterium]MCA9767334.1 response regulator [Gemmatimonadota bacterium]MCB9518594.1 response regulator [Gemmatimonadales bacterium]